MADNIEQKTILTRIINKNAKLDDWQKSDLPLKTGEIALAYVETLETTHKLVVDAEGNPVIDETTGKQKVETLQTIVPTYLMKVGHENKKFSELQWLAAPASDVYPWAKKAQLAIEDLPASWRDEVQQAITDVNEHKTTKLDTATYNAFIAPDGDFGKIKATVEDFFSTTANADQVVNRLVEIQEILETTTDAADLIQRVAALEDWFDTYSSQLEKVVETYVKHSATDVEYILDCGDHTIRTITITEPDTD